MKRNNPAKLDFVAIEIVIKFLDFCVQISILDSTRPLANLHDRAIEIF